MVSPITPESAVTGLTATPPAQLEPVGRIANPSYQRRLRLWPGLVIVALELLIITVPGWVVPGTLTHFLGMFWGPMAAAVGVAMWWLLASRISWRDRGLILLVGVGGGVAAALLSHPSFGFYGMILVGIPLATSAWVLWLLLTPMLPWSFRRLGLVAALLLVWGYCIAVRVDGFDGSFATEKDWRWNPTAEEQLLAKRALQGPHRAATAPIGKGDVQSDDWPGFRGPNRDGRRSGVRIATDWDQHPPRRLWRNDVGPGWSSFAVAGDCLYTQEQLGDDEVVVCYRASTGKVFWMHKDSARFSERVSGAGPRATPTIHDGKIYTLGAAGRLNCLDAATGKPIWSRDIAEDSGAKAPTWGFSSSPLVARGVVTVFAGGPDGKSVLGYDAVKGGKPLWAAGEGLHSYCSPQLSRLAGVDQILITTEMGAMALHPTQGKVLWKHDWPTSGGEGGLPRCVQPAVVSDTDVLIGSGFNEGTRRLRLTRSGDEWQQEEEWTSRDISPYYNDLVIHKDHLYGFDGMFFTCVSLEDGKRKWRMRGYGNGQVLLLPDQELLLVLSEKGEAALVEASPQRHKRLGRFQAIKGKTWNHPVVAHGKLFVRNDREAACYDLSRNDLADGPAEKSTP